MAESLCGSCNMSSNIGTLPEPAEQPTGYNPPTLLVPSRRFVIHQISEAELDTIAASGSSLELTLFGICAGAVVSLFITITTVSIPSPRAFAAYVSSTIITALAAMFFGWRGIGAHVAGLKKLAEIRRGNPTTVKP